MTADLDRHLILSIQQADNHLLLIDEFAKERMQEAADTGDAALAETYQKIITASEEAKAKLYGVRDEFRTILRATGLGHLSGAGQYDH